MTEVLAPAPEVPPVGEGYEAVFYEIAAMLGIGARPQSPAVVWATEMKPKLLSRLSRQSDPAGDDGSISAQEAEIPDMNKSGDASLRKAVAWLTTGGEVTRSYAYAVEQSVNDPENYPKALTYSKPKKRSEITIGMVIAAAIVAASDDVLAGEILGACGMTTRAKMIAAGCEEYDIDKLAFTLECMK